MAKSILGRKRVIPISKTLEIVEYDYVFVEGVDAKRPNNSYTERRRGWTMIGDERECVKVKEGHLYTHRYVWQKNSHK